MLRTYVTAKTSSRHDKKKRVALCASFLHSSAKSKAKGKKKKEKTRTCRIGWPGPDTFFSRKIIMSLQIANVWSEYGSMG